MTIVLRLIGSVVEHPLVFLSGVAVGYLVLPKQPVVNLLKRGLTWLESLKGKL